MPHALSVWQRELTLNTSRLGYGYWHIGSFGWFYPVVGAPEGHSREPKGGCVRAISLQRSFVAILLKLRLGTLGPIIFYFQKEGIPTLHNLFRQSFHIT